MIHKRIPLLVQYFDVMLVFHFFSFATEYGVCIWAGVHVAVGSALCYSRVRGLKSGSEGLRAMGARVLQYG